MQKYVKNTYKYQKIARVLCLIIPRAVIDMFSITVYSIDFFFTSICITLRKDHNIFKILYPSTKCNKYKCHLFFQTKCRHTDPYKLPHLTLPEVCISS